MGPQLAICVLHITPRIKRKEGGIEHLEAVYALVATYIASLYYYPVLCERGKKGGAAPPFGRNTGLYIV